MVGACGTLGVVDGFAKVSHQLDWIRDLGDDYVKTCSAKLPLEYQCNQSKFCSKDNEQCVKNKCQCNYGFVRINGDCLGTQQGAPTSFSKKLEKFVKLKGDLHFFARI